jgi:MYXO-CTERM domain-containing protein
MRKTTEKRLLTLLAALAGGTSAHAATPIAGDPLEGGIAYAYQLTLGGSDSGQQSSHVGAWSWEDQGIAPAGGEGWTHTSNWFALTLTQDSVLTLTIERDPTVPFVGSGNVGGFAAVDSMFPSFTLWRNWDNDLMTPEAAADLGYPDPLAAHDHHVFANTGAVLWAEDLTYITHTANTTLESITASLPLTAGQYSVVIGSDAPSAESPPRQGYRALFSTSSIPEPGSAALAVLAALAGVARRRRR